MSSVLQLHKKQEPYYSELSVSFTGVWSFNVMVTFEYDFQYKSYWNISWVFFKSNCAVGGAIILLCQNVSISTELNIKWTAHHFVNSSIVSSRKNPCKAIWFYIVYGIRSDFVKFRLKKLQNVCVLKKSSKKINLWKFSALINIFSAILN